MRACASLLSVGLLLAGCHQAGGDFGFRTESVILHPAHQSIEARIRQQLALSREAEDALEHGVALTVVVELELRDALSLTLLSDDRQHFAIRYLPLSQHYQLSGPDEGKVRNFPRLRHVLAALSNLDLQLRTGPLAPGQYELRVRTWLDSGHLPAPMRLPALTSAQWHHDSEWSTWPFEIGA